MGKASSRSVKTANSLEDWLEYIQQIHFRSIDMTLDRVTRVLDNLDLGQTVVPVIAVSGTNGKGSTVAMLEAIYRAAGYTPGSYTSPHLLAFNERIKVGGQAVSDTQICNAFTQIEAARGCIPLTYFEFATLAALWIFASLKASPLLLEVGMGGRLDAVNDIDADVAMVSSIGLDHQAWLGDDRETIAREKAGIFRSGKWAICADPEPPMAISEAADQVGAKLLLLERDFKLQKEGQGTWHWQSQQDEVALDSPELPIPGGRQWQNAAAVLMAVSVLQGRMPVSKAAILTGMSSTKLAGRLQVLAEHPQLLVDVAHNPQAVEILCEYLKTHPVPGKTYAVFGALADKNVAAVCQLLESHIDHWLVAGLPGERGSTATQTVAKMPDSITSGNVQIFGNVAGALDQARRLVGATDRILAFGSFLVVGAIIPRFESKSG